jgi:hypothetical protein
VRAALDGTAGIPPVTASTLVYRSFAALISLTASLYGIFVLGWDAAPLVLLFVLDGICVALTDIVRWAFMTDHARRQTTLVIELVFILFYGCFALLVFGPYPSLQEAVDDRFARIGALVAHDIRGPLLAVVAGRVLRLVQDLFAARTGANTKRRPLELIGGGMMLILFFAVMAAPFVTRHGPNPVAGMAAITILKTVGELLDLWAPRLFPARGRRARG